MALFKRKYKNGEFVTDVTGKTLRVIRYIEDGNYELLDGTLTVVRRHKSELK